MSRNFLDPFLSERYTLSRERKFPDLNFTSDYITSMLNISPNSGIEARAFVVGSLAALAVIFSSVAIAQTGAKIELQDQAGQTLTTIDLLDSTSITIDPLTGDLIAVPADSAVCTGSGECDATVQIESFSIDPATITQGGRFTATFDERGAFECSRSGLSGTTWNAGFQDPDGSVINVTIPSSVATGEYDLVLTCRNGSASPNALATLTRRVTITEPDAAIPQECVDQGRLAPSGWQQELNPLPNSTSTVVSTWEQLFGNPFPGGGSNDVRVRPNRYLALAFNTASSAPSGRIAFSDLSGNVVGVLTRPAIATMSNCPGDFAPQQDADCRQVRVGTNVPSFRWTRTAGGLFACDLPLNADYYLNVAYVSSATQDMPDPNDLDWQCDPTAPTTACGHRLQTFSD